MTQTDNNTRLAQLAGHLSQQMGLNFPKERLGDLKHSLTHAAKDFGFQNVDSCAEWLLSSSLTRQRIEILASHLTVGETYFFREKKSLEVLKKDILNGIRSRKGEDRNIRIWSAGCASGEEPYSIAISLVEAMPDIADWNITILATDINPHSLQKALRGIYSKWSFRDCPPELKRKYFRETKEKTFEIVPDIKKLVSFAYHNLAEDSYPSVYNNTDAMDVVFCRNVLMYFVPEIAERVADKLYYCLVDDGRLIVSQTETSPVFNSRFSIVNYPNSTIYKKNPKSVGMSTAETGTKPTEKGSYQSAKVFLKQEQSTRDEKDIERTPEEQPDDAREIILRAKIQANQGKLAEAAQLCRKGISKDKINPVYYYLLANILHEMGQIAEASDSLRQAIFLDPGFVLAYFTLGNLTLRIGKLKESTKYFKNALSLLKKYRPDEILAESDGITAGRLVEVISRYVEEPL